MKEYKHTISISGEYEIGETTDSYDCDTYAQVLERLTYLRLNCFWKVNLLRKGAMMMLNKNGEQERIFVKSFEAFLKMEDSLIKWANEKVGNQ